MEDSETLPLAELVPGINSVCLVIFLHPLASGLLRVKLAGHVGKSVSLFHMNSDL